MSDPVSWTGGGLRPARPPNEVWFDRTELSAILRVYGRLVASGDLRDYAIGAFVDHATFCMYRRASEAPTWTIEKRPDLSRKQGAWSVVNATGQILKRGRELELVLRVFDRRRFDIID